MSILGRQTFIISSLLALIFLSQLSVASINPDKNKSPNTDHKKQLNQSNGMLFTQNKGQVIDMDHQLRPDILFKADIGGADIYLRKTGLSYVLSNSTEVHEVEEQKGKSIYGDKQSVEQELFSNKNVKMHRVDIDFVNCNHNTQVITSDQSEGYRNYYYAHCPQGITNVHSYNEVTIKNIYNNIDVKYYACSERSGKSEGLSAEATAQAGLKYDIVVNPGADPNQIKLKYSGADGMEINPSAGSGEELIIKNSIGEIRERLPKVYQNINGKIVDVKTEYELERLSNNDVIVYFSFFIFNPSFPLVIDPWVSYYGGSTADYGNSVTTDPTSGDVAFCGSTGSINFPVSTGAFQTTLNGAQDAFVVKMNPNGSLLWATYIGGSNSDAGNGIATDNSGNIFVTGSTWSTDFPVLAGHQMLFGGFLDVFLFKLDPSGARLWATYYGGTDLDDPCAVASDGTNIYLYGSTNSTNAISTLGSFQPVYAGADYFLGSGYGDNFLVKFSSTGVRAWGTYIGGSTDDAPGGVACDPIGNIYIGGFTVSTNLVATVHQTTYGGGEDAFLFKFNSAGVLQWSTYYGGASMDRGKAVATDKLGNVYLAGATSSANPNVISTAGAFQAGFGGSIGWGDGFLVKFNNAGVRQWGTYIGGSSDEWILYLTTDNNNNIYVLGEMEDYGPGNYSASSCAYQSVFGGGPPGPPPAPTGNEDQLIAKYDANGKQICITFLGGPNEEDVEIGGGIAVNGSILYVTGTNYGGSYPVTANALQPNYGGGFADAFIGQLCINLCETKVLGLSFTANATSVCANVPVTFTPAVANSCDTTGYKFHWTFSGGSPATSDSMKPTVIFPGVGNHDVKLVLTTVCKKDSISKINYITINPCNTCLLVGQFVKGTSNCSTCGCKEWIMINATGGTSPYTYSWPDGYVNRYKNHICPGSYTINIKDKNGCTMNITVSAP